MAIADPTGIATPQMWGEARTSLQSGGPGTNATALNDKVNANHLIQATAGNQGIDAGAGKNKRLAIPNWRAGGADAAGIGYTFPTGMAIDPHNACIAMALQLHGLVNAGSFIRSADGQFMIRRGANNNAALASDPTVGVGGNEYVQTALKLSSSRAILLYNYTASGLTVRVNDSEAALATFNGGPYTNITLGNLAGFSDPTAPFNLYEIALYPRSLTTNERQDLTDYLATNNQVVRSGFLANVVYDGDSIWYGLGGTANLNTSHQVTLNGNQPIQEWNTAINGQSVESMVSLAPTTVDPLFNSGITNNICFVHGGANDMIIHGHTPAEAYAFLSTYIAARKAAGWKVLVCTLGGGISSPMTEANVITYNGLIRAGAAAGGYAVADIGADPMIGTFATNTDTRYYQTDHLHGTEQWYARAAGICSQLLAATINAPHTGSSGNTGYHAS